VDGVHRLYRVHVGNVLAQLLQKSFEKQSQFSLPTKPMIQSQNHHFAWFYWHQSA
jgi:hypothetical protein